MPFQKILLFAGIVCITASLSAMEKTSVVEERKVTSKVTREELLTLLTENQEPSVVEIAHEILDRIFNVGMRYVKCADGTTKYGYVFFGQPEILADLMQSCKGKTVLEIAGASGDNALCLGLAGAEKVYLNDIEPAEIAAFEQTIQRLPENLQQKFVSVPGDCFSVFNDASYNGKFDVIYARNIFHFFLGNNRSQFITLMYRLLKPGGKLVVTTNILKDIDLDTGKKVKPGTYAIRARAPKIRSDIQGEYDATPLFTQFSEPQEDLTNIDPLKYFFNLTITFSRDGIVKNGGFTFLNKENQKKVITRAKQLIKEKGLENLIKTNTRIVSHDYIIVGYSTKRLSEAFKSLPFENINAVYTDECGHICDEAKAQHATAIFHKPLQICFSCKKAPEKPQKCSRCQKAVYCNADCQKAHWAAHKLECQDPKV